MTAGQVTADVGRDGRSVDVTLQLPGAPQSAVTLDAAGLDHAIATLAKARAALQPPVKTVLGDDDVVVSTKDYGWAVARRKTNGLRMLSVRHPGHGWLGFAMADEDAKALADWLVRKLPG